MNPTQTSVPSGTRRAASVLGKFAFLRPGDWLTKHARVLVCMLVVILVQPGDYAWTAVASIAFSVVGFLYAFGLNYYLERDLDELVGKNRVRDLGTRTAAFLFVGLSAALFAIPAAMGNLAATLVALYYWIMATMYSWRPIFLKARGLLSVASQAVWLEVTHFLFFVCLTGYRNPWGVACLSAWLVLAVAKGATIHQIIGLDNDAKLGLRTLAVAYGRDRAIKIVGGMTWSLYVYSLVPFAVFPFPVALLLALAIVFSNAKYRR